MYFSIKAQWGFPFSSIGSIIFCCLILSFDILYPYEYFTLSLFKIVTTNILASFEIFSLLVKIVTSDVDINSYGW